MLEILSMDIGTRKQALRGLATASTSEHGDQLTEMHIIRFEVVGLTLQDGYRSKHDI